MEIQTQEDCPSYPKETLLHVQLIRLKLETSFREFSGSSRVNMHLLNVKSNEGQSSSGSPAPQPHVGHSPELQSSEPPIASDGSQSRAKPVCKVSPLVTPIGFNISQIAKWDLTGQSLKALGANLLSSLPRPPSLKLSPVREEPLRTQKKVSCH